MCDADVVVVCRRNCINCDGRDGIGYMGAASIAQFLATNTTLTSLDLA